MVTKMRILLVDDDPEIVRGLAIRLRARGYEVIAASDGQAGLSAAREHQPDAILLDLRMPVLDGLAMLDALRKSDSIADIPVIVLSANIAPEARSEALARGARYHLNKPYDAETVIGALESVLAPPCTADSDSN